MSKQEEMTGNEKKGQAGRPPYSGKKPGIDWATAKRLLTYMKEYRVTLIFVVICILISSVAMVMMSLFVQTLIDDYVTPMLAQADPDFSGLALAIARMACIFAVGAVTTWLYNWSMAKVSQGTLKSIRNQMFSHMQSLPIRYFDQNTFGDIMSHFTNDTDALRQMISMSIPALISSLVSVVSVFFSMLYLSIWMTLFVIAFLFLVLFIVKVVAGRSGTYFVRQQRDIADVNGYIEEMIGGQKVIKVFNHERAAEQVFDQKNENLRESVSKANTYANILMPIMNNMGHVLYVLLAVIGGVLAIAGVTNISLHGAGALTLGMMASFLTLAKAFINPISQISNQLNAIIMALAGAKRIFQLLDEPSEEDEGYVRLVDADYDENGNLVKADHKTDIWAWEKVNKDGRAEYRKLEGDVVLEDVDFSYVPGKQILHDINIYARPGQKVAFVGATGAGKTTITNLINRFYDIDSGSIFYDGIDIGKIRKPDLRRSLGVVLQDVNLFTGTVMDNIRYGKLDATDEECIAAAKLANADSFIRMLPDGYDTVLEGDGSGLSQGQRQLISIARAAVADPPVMVLDEATSSIDTRTEALVQKGMDALMAGRTVFVIAHRLSTVRNSDVIMVLDHGRIIERGDHDRLIAEKGVYYQLYTGAFELE